MNKRTEPRSRCLVPVESKSNSSFDATQTTDISSHGIGFISSHPHRINEKMAIEIQLKPDTEPVVVIGKVKWVHRFADGSAHYRIGMKYEDQR